jgi:hypothetical protein
MDISQHEPNNGGWTRVSYKRKRPAREEEEYQGGVKPKRATIGSIQLPHLTDTQLYWMRTDTNNSKTDLETHQNLHQYMEVALQPFLHSCKTTIRTQSTLKQSDQNPAKNF